MRTPFVDGTCTHLASGPATPGSPAANRASRNAATEADACRYIIDLVYDRSRIRLHQGKDALIKARVGKLMRRQGITSLADYVERLRAAPHGAEATSLVDAMTTNFTHFLREADHFDFLVRQALPRALGQRPRSFHVWSAASSTGEEPYTLAMYLAEHYPPDRGWDWHVIASDISTKVLAEAQRGIYPAERVGAIPREWLRRYFQHGTGQWSGFVRVKPDLARRVTYRPINLAHDYEHALRFPVVFCRNVMIYFDRPTQEQVVTRLCRFLQPGGYLIVGHSESLNGLDVPLLCLKPSIYQRR